MEDKTNALEPKENCCVTPEASEKMSQYWDRNFQANKVQNWSEPSEPAILSWFVKHQIPKEATIFCAGVGDANIVSQLIGLGYQNIIANDISPIAIEKLRKTIDSDSVTFLQDDLIKPTKITEYYGKVDVYIDRATLHFFTKCVEKDFYFQQLRDLLKPNGIGMLGVFSKDNVPKCCGLDLQLWSMESLKNRLEGYEFHDEFYQAFEERNERIRNYIYLMAGKNMK